MAGWRRFFAFFAVALVAGCTDPVDRAAEKRIFSPEDPPAVVASASEKLPAGKAATDRHVAERIIQMSAVEITQRLGPHRTTATLGFTWTAPKVDPVELTETRTVDAGPGGVGGDFHATENNSRDQGLEVIRVGDAVYARSRYGTFRQRLRGRGRAELEREQVSGALWETAKLFRNRLSLTAEGKGVYDGRAVWKYAVSLGEPPAPAAPKVELPPLAVPDGGYDATTLRRRDFFQHRAARSIEGELWVDAKTSVVLKAHLDGQITVPATQDRPEAHLALQLDQTVSEIGVDPDIVPPKDFLPDENKPNGIADALERFGVMAAPKQTDEGAPDEPDDPDDAPSQKASSKN